MRGKKICIQWCGSFEAFIRSDVGRFGAGQLSATNRSDGRIHVQMPVSLCLDDPKTPAAASMAMEGLRPIHSV